MPAGQGISGDRRVGVADVGRVVDVVDGRRRHKTGPPARVPAGGQDGRVVSRPWASAIPRRRVDLPLGHAEPRPPRRSAALRPPRRPVRPPWPPRSLDLARGRRRAPPTTTRTPPVADAPVEPIDGLAERARARPPRAAWSAPARPRHGPLRRRPWPDRRRCRPPGAEPRRAPTVRGSASDGSQPLPALAPFLGRKPSKQNRSAGSPDSHQAARTAEGPGTTSTGTAAAAAPNHPLTRVGDPGHTGVAHHRHRAPAAARPTTCSAGPPRCADGCDTNRCAAMPARLSSLRVWRVSSQTDDVGRRPGRPRRGATGRPGCRSACRPTRTRPTGAVTLP